MSEAKWYLRTQDETFGPETEAKLVEWARLGRIQPGQEVSEDNIEWRRVEDVPFLDMRFSIDIGDGNPRGPFNRAAAAALLASGRLPKTASMVEVRAPFTEAAPEKAPVAPGQGEGAPQSKDAAVPQVVEKVVVDETRVKELEGMLAEERRHTADLQARLDESSRNAAAAAKEAVKRENALKADLAASGERADKLEASLRDAADRESKYDEQVRHLEDELRRLPQAASEVADIQAAVYSIIKGEAEDLGRIIDQEKREFEDQKRRHTERLDRLVERRREMLKRSGTNIEEMTRRALIDRPEDPRTVQLRKELDELRRVHERTLADSQEQIRGLTEQLRARKAEEARMSEGMKDVTQLRREVQELRERLQLREKELVVERQRSEELNRQQATRQQTLLARLAALESPSIGTAQSMSTNQSREAKQVKLPGWMHLR